MRLGRKTCRVAIAALEAGDLRDMQRKKMLDERDRCHKLRLQERKKMSHPSGWMRMGGDDVIPTVSQHQ